jgi:plastocyanin
MKRTIRNAAFCGALFVAVALTVVIHAGRLARADDGKAASSTIVIDNFSFTPRELTVAPGVTVTWVNQDDVPHTVVSTEKKFRSMALDTGDRFSFTFTDAGAYPYFCSVHPMMTGKVIVK